MDEANFSILEKFECSAGAFIKSIKNEASLSTLTLLCGQYLHPSPELFHLPQLRPCLLDANDCSQPLVPPFVVLSMNLGG